MGGRVVKRAFTYRFYPSEQQARELNRTFGCVRKVYNLALEARTKAWYSERRRITYVQSSAMLTGWKREPGLAFLGEGPACRCSRHCGTCRARSRTSGRSGRSTRRSRPSGARGRRVARVHARITDRRRDHLHKLTTRLVRENQAVVIEDLQVRNMLGNH